MGEYTIGDEIRYARTGQFGTVVEVNENEDGSVRSYDVDIEGTIYIVEPNELN